jgi:lysophospholipase
LSAPFYADVAEGPADAVAFWLTAADGVRIRVALWNRTGAKGTVLLLPGRTEYVEKYGRTAGDLAAAGFATLSVDWRGQGLSDRALGDRMVGHVGDFAEFQADFNAMLVFARIQNLPQPFFLMTHSMGGCIGLRCLVRGAPVQAAAFSAPMLGILMADWMRPAANILSSASRWFGFHHHYAPGTNARTYVVEAPFQGNTLTTDPEMWDYMRRQCLTHPDLALGGPSYGWLKAALDECADLAALPSPAYPMLCALGTNERIVDTRPIHDRMARWPGGQLQMVDGAEHEVLMEKPAIRATFIAQAVALFEAHS